MNISSLEPFWTFPLKSVFPDVAGAENHVNNSARNDHARLAPCGVNISGATLADCTARPASSVDWISIQ